MIGGIYVLLSRIIFPGQSFSFLYYSLTDAYQSFMESIAEWYLRLIDTGISIRDHRVFLEGNQYGIIENGMLKKRMTLITLALIWLIPVKNRLKIIYSLTVAVMLLAFLPIGIAINAFFNTFDFELMAPYRIGQTLPILGFLTIAIYWIKKNREFFRKIVRRVPVAAEMFERKAAVIIALLYIFVILRTFIIGYFPFEGWVNIIFRISASAINFLGYNAKTVPFYLYGDNVLIFMNKSCLGFTTMFVFASVVFLTGEKKLATWIYILVGIVILNLLNVLRFVLLYSYLSKHGKYLLSIDIHDIYSGGIYIMVFLLWILWFEKFNVKKTV